MHKTPIDQIERIARVFHGNQDASRALGITHPGFQPSVPSEWDRNPLCPHASSQAADSPALVLQPYLPQSEEASLLSRGWRIGAGPHRLVNMKTIKRRYRGYAYYSTRGTIFGGRG